MKKRIVALAAVSIVLALVAATLVVLRTRWAAERICALLASRAAAATGLPLSYRACRVEPLSLHVEADGVRLGPADAPVFTADRIAAQLAAVQPFGGRVRIAHVTVERPRLTIRPGAAGGGPPGRCSTDPLGRVEVREAEISGAALDVAFASGVRLRVAELDLRVRPGDRSLRALAAGPRAQVALAAGGVRLDGVGDRPFTSPHLTVAAAIPQDLSAIEIASAEARVDGVSLVARGGVDDLCAPRLDLHVTGGGPLREVLALARIREDAPAEGTVTTEARVAGPARRPEISGTVRFERARVGWFRPLAGRATVRVAPELDALLVDRVEWPLPGGRAVVRGRVGFQRHVPMEWEVETEGADLADVLESVGIEGSWVTVRLDGKGKLAGTVAPLRLDGAFAGDFSELRSYARSWKTVKPDVVPVIEVRRGRLETPIRITDEAIAFDGARASSGRGTSVVDAVTRLSEAGGFQVRWQGQLDLDALGAVAGIPVGGLAEVDATLGAAPYGNPRATGRARAEGIRFLDVALGNGSCEFDYGPDFLLRVREAEGTFRQSRWRAEGLVDLEPSPAAVRWSRFETKGRVKDLFDAVQDWLPRTRPFRDVVDGEIEVSGTGHGPAGRLDGTFDARMATGTFLGRPFDSARLAGTFADGEEARYERAELRRGAGVVRMTGRSAFASPFPWDLDVAVAGVSLGDLGLPGSGWAGSASGTANLRGSFQRPDVRFAANGDGVSAGGLALGTLQLAGTVLEERLVVTGSAEGLRFEAEATLEGRVPFRARADLALENVTRLVPGGAASGLEARVKGEATAEGELAALDQARARVRVDEVQAAHAEFKVRSTAPVVVTASRGRVELQPLTLVGPNTELTLAGSRAASGQLDLSAGGTLDLRLLAGMIPDLRRPHGQLAVEAHVSGTAAEPVLVGSGRLEDAGFQLKSTPVLLAELRGALAFSQNRVLFEDLSAAVNGGRAKLRGEVELASFVPSRLRVEAVLDEVPLAVPAWLPATVSGRVEASGTPAEATVAGRLHVVRARYTADVALERSLLEVRRRAAPPPRAYDKAGEWLRLDLQVVVDGDARVENDLVSGAVRGEITVTGTLAAPGVVGTLAMTEGSRARFRGNEFALSHAVLEFTSRNRLELALDVHGQSQVRDYQIFMHAFGPLSDPQLTLTSTPPLSQPDIITLLSLGFTRRDAAAGTGAVQGVATAAAAQALFSASGLDEQVRRFLPRSQMVRDLSVRITSEWSEASGQVEPRAEFESFLLRERLRLRFQAPLSGARGQKAQAELRFGRHTAVQYQWDPDNLDVPTGDHGVDLKLRWEWTDE